MDLILSILSDTGNVLLTYIPYILFGILLAEILKFTPFTRVLRQVISSRPLVSVFISSTIGIFSPLSTFGTVPIVINLYREGVILAPLITFLSASSLMNPQLFIITWGSLGLDFAILRMISIVLFTVSVGLIIRFYESSKGKLIMTGVNPKLVNHTSSNFEKTWRDFRLPSFIKGYLGNLEFVGYYVLIGVLVSVTVENLMPVEKIISLSSDIQWLSVFFASLIGIPLYVCGGATIPLVQTLLANGWDIGSALSFFIVGPGTRLVILAALGSFLSSKMIALYVASLIFFAMLMGNAVNQFLL